MKKQFLTILAVVFAAVAFAQDVEIGRVGDVNLVRFKTAAGIDESYARQNIRSEQINNGRIIFINSENDRPIISNKGFDLSEVTLSTADPLFAVIGATFTDYDDFYTTYGVLVLGKTKPSGEGEGASSADAVSFDPSTSTLTDTNVQDAIVSIAHTGASPHTVTKVADYTALRAIITPSDGDLVFVTDELRYGLFRYDSNFSSTDNGGTIIDGWVRDEPYVFKPRYWGAIGDWDHTTQIGTDDSAALVAMIAAVPVTAENVLAFTDPTATIVFEANKRYRITEDLTITRRNLLIEGNKSVIVNDSDSDFAINLQNARGVKITDLNILLTKDNVGVGGIRAYKTYNIIVDGVDVKCNIAYGTKQSNTVGMHLETALGDTGDNLYGSYENMIFRGLGTGIFAETDDTEGDFSRTNSTKFNNIQFFGNQVGIHLRGVWGSNWTDIDLENVVEQFRFETNDQGLGTRYNKFQVNWFESNSLVDNYADAASFDNEIEYLYYGNVRDGIIDSRVINFTLDNQNITYGDRIRNEKYGFNLVRISHFEADYVWRKTNSGSSSIVSITGGQGILNVVDSGFALLEYLITYKEGATYEVEFEAYSDEDGAKLRAQDDTTNNGGMIAQDNDPTKTFGEVTLTTTPTVYKKTYTTNSFSNSIAFTRGTVTGSNVNIYLNYVNVKRVVTAKSKNISYDNTDSGLTAADVQGAIDEMAAASGGTLDTSIINGSTNAATGDAIFDALALKGNLTTSNVWTGPSNYFNSGLFGLKNSDGSSTFFRISNANIFTNETGGTFQIGGSALGARLSISPVAGSTPAFALRLPTGSTSDVFRFNTTGNSDTTGSLMLMQSDGDVGINQTLPTQKLHVGGNVKADAIVLTSADGTEYIITVANGGTITVTPL